jgi:murein DD-endopeptidase MepM/ murein hydrolase activator NlpD
VRARPDGITATLLAVQAGQPDPIVLGGLGAPIPGADLASPFGLRNDPLGGGAGFHPGMDLAATSGTQIHASAEGVVVTAGDCGGYGNCVVIDHGNSIATLYGHQSQVLVSVGEHVDAGQVVGLVGSTGMSTGPHLHFEVRLHGIPIDPLLALSRG